MFYDFAINQLTYSLSPFVLHIDSSSSNVTFKEQSVLGKEDQAQDLYILISMTNPMCTLRN